MKQFRELASNHNPVQLCQQMESDGYVLIRDLIDRRKTKVLFGEISRILLSAGWITPGSEEQDRTANITLAAAEGDPHFKSVYDQVFRLPSFHSFPHQASLSSCMMSLVGRKLLIHPKPAARLIFPNYERGTIYAHQDHRAVGGDTKGYTAWLPLHDCPPDEGPLQILAGSHQYGLQKTAGQTGYIPAGEERGAEWVSGEVRAGDLLLFHSLTVHRASPNISTKLRVSMDFRFQSYTHAVNPAAFVFTGSSERKSWPNIYREWVADELQYYWMHSPLRFKPTRTELAELARTCDQENDRSRYARILERLDAQMHPQWSASSDDRKELVH